MYQAWHRPYPGIDRQSAPLNNLPAGGSTRQTNGVNVGNWSAATLRLL